MSTNTHSLPSGQPFSAELIFAGPETLNVRAPGAKAARQLPSTAAPVSTRPAFTQQGR